MNVTKDQIVDRLLSESKNMTADDKKNLLRELLQESILCHMKEVGLFEDMGFHGGTSLRLLHRINRFSEDLDMSLHKVDSAYNLPSGMAKLEGSMKRAQINIEFKDKCKEDTPIKKFWLNDTEILNENSDELQNVVPGEKIKIKFELDVEPPEHQEFTYSKIKSVFSEEIYAHNLETCMGQKIHAVLCRGFDDGMDIVKGKDLYDLEWYLEKGIRPNLKNLSACLNRVGPWKGQGLWATVQWTKKKIREKLGQHDFKLILKDVQPLVDANEFKRIKGLWSLDHYAKLLEKLSAHH